MREWEERVFRPVVENFASFITNQKISAGDPNNISEYHIQEDIEHAESLGLPPLMAISWRSGRDMHDAFGSIEAMKLRTGIIMNALFCVGSIAAMVWLFNESSSCTDSRCLSLFLFMSLSSLIISGGAYLCMMGAAGTFSPGSDPASYDLMVAILLFSTSMGFSRLFHIVLSWAETSSRFSIRTRAALVFREVGPVVLSSSVSSFVVAAVLVKTAIPALKNFAFALIGASVPIFASIVVIVAGLEIANGWIWPEDNSGTDLHNIIRANVEKTPRGSSRKRTAALFQFSSRTTPPLQPFAKTIILLNPSERIVH